MNVSAPATTGPAAHGEVMTTATLLLQRDRAWRFQLALLALGEVDGLQLPKVPEWADPVWQLYAICHPDRDACRAALQEHGIGTLIHYPVPPHRSGAYPDCNQLRFPVTERIAP